MKYHYLGLWIASLAACATDPYGTSVYDARVRELQIERRGGGFGGDGPADAACHTNFATYTLTMADHRLAWKYCVASTTGDTTTYTPKTGARALAATEWTALEPRLAALVTSGKATCGADKEEQALIVTRDGGAVEYGDDFYACRDRAKPYVAGDALDAAREALHALASK